MFNLITLFMRKVTEQAVVAFLNSYPFKSSNTKVVIEDDGVCLYLHSNLIAIRKEEGMFIRNAGWFSNTTKERLNGLPNVSIYQKKGTWYLNGQEWNGGLTKIN